MTSPPNTETITVPGTAVVASGPFTDIVAGEITPVRAPSLVESVECFHSYMGMWMIEPEFLRRALLNIQLGDFRQQTPLRAAEHQERSFALEQGIAIVPIHGSMQKGDSKFGGTSTVRARRQIRSAVRDSRVSGILLHVDSPGGMQAGSFELAEEVRRAAEQKLVHAHIDDLGASAAYWALSQAAHVAINAPGEVGSIGTYAVVFDESKRAEAAGVTVHVISTGDMKGSLVPGTAVTESLLKDLQSRVDAVNEHFLASVSQGRGLEGARLAGVSTGKVFPAADGLAMGLVDTIQTFEESLGELREKAGAKGPQPSAAAVAAEIDTEEVAG